MDQGEVVEKAKKSLAFLQEDVLGVLIYGSWATGESHERSGICIVAPSVEDKIALWRKAIASIHDDRYDVRIFELLPLFLPKRGARDAQAGLPGKTRLQAVSFFSEPLQFSLALIF